MQIEMKMELLKRLSRRIEEIEAEVRGLLDEIEEGYKFIAEKKGQLGELETERARVLVEEGVIKVGPIDQAIWYANASIRDKEAYIQDLWEKVMSFGEGSVKYHFLKSFEDGHAKKD